MGKEIKNKTLQGVKWNLVQDLSGQLIGFLVFVLLARLLQPQDFGVVALASVFVAFLGPFITAGFGTAIVQREVLEPEHLDTAFWVNVGVGSLLTLLGVLAAPLLATLFEQPELGPVLTWLFLSLVFLSLTSVQQGIVRRDMNFKALALRTMLSQLIAGIVAVGMAFQDFGVWSLVARQVVQSLVSLVLLWRISDWRPSLRFSRKHFNDLFGFGLNSMGSELLIFVNRRSDNLLIGYFLGPVALGYYAVAYRLFNLMFQLISSAITKVGMPAFARIQSDREKVNRVLISMTQITAVIAFPAFFGVAVFVPELVPLLFGEQWMPSVPVMQVLVFIGIAQCLIRPMVSLIVGLGRPNWRLRLQVIDAFANVTGFFIAVKWGIVAVAASYVIIGYLQAPLWFLTVRRLARTRAREYLAALLAPLSAVILMLVSVVALKYYLAPLVPPTVLILAGAVVGSLVYILAIYRLSPEAAARMTGLLKVFLPATRKPNA